MKAPRIIAVSQIEALQGCLNRAIAKAAQTGGQNAAKTVMELARELRELQTYTRRAEKVASASEIAVSLDGASKKRADKLSLAMQTKRILRGDK